MVHQFRKVVWNDLGGGFQVDREDNEEKEEEEEKKKKMNTRSHQERTPHSNKAFWASHHKANVSSFRYLSVYLGGGEGLTFKV